MSHSHGRQRIFHIMLADLLQTNALPIDRKRDRHSLLTKCVGTIPDVLLFPYRKIFTVIYRKGRGQRVRAIDDKIFAIVLKGCKERNQLFGLIMIFVDIEQHPDVRMILHDRPITLISLNDQPLSFSGHGIADLSFFDNTYQPCAANDAGLVSPTIENIK